MSDYLEFCKKKLKKEFEKGIIIDENDLNKNLFDYQKLIVKVALERGRYLIGAECGLGKTLMQLEWSRVVNEYTKKPVLIVAPLGVAKQTESEEAAKFGYFVNIIRKLEDIKPGINITNYEIVEHFSGFEWGGVVLDESSILKNFMGKTRLGLSSAFKDINFKLCCSATPAPNEFMELLNQADFLGIQETAKTLSNYFVNDFVLKKWRLKGHATNEFWKWVCSWACLFSKPSDLGFSDEGYSLPKLIERNNIIKVDTIDYTFQNGLVRDINMSATSYHKEKKFTLDEKIKKCSEIATFYKDEQFIIWCETNEESSKLKQALKLEAVEVKGSDNESFREKAIQDFKTGKVRIIISKPSIFGYGMNFQNCHRAIFCGLSYSYENYYQAVRRLHRYGQERDVIIDIVIGETELQILNVVREKEQRQAEIKNQMQNSVKDIQKAILFNKEYKVDFKDEVVKLPSWL